MEGTCLAISATTVTNILIGVNGICILGIIACLLSKGDDFLGWPKWLLATVYIATMLIVNIFAFGGQATAAECSRIIGG